MGTSNLNPNLIFNSYSHTAGVTTTASLTDAFDFTGAQSGDTGKLNTGPTILPTLFDFTVRALDSATYLGSTTPAVAAEATITVDASNPPGVPSGKTITIPVSNSGTSVVLSSAASENTALGEFEIGGGPWASDTAIATSIANCINDAAAVGITATSAGAVVTVT